MHHAASLRVFTLLRCMCALHVTRKSREWEQLRLNLLRETERVPTIIFVTLRSCLDDIKFFYSISMRIFTAGLYS